MYWSYDYVYIFFFCVSVHNFNQKKTSDLKHQGRFSVANWMKLLHSEGYFSKFILIKKLHRKTEEKLKMEKYMAQRF